AKTLSSFVVAFSEPLTVNGQFENALCGVMRGAVGRWIPACAGMTVEGDAGVVFVRHAERVSASMPPHARRLRRRDVPPSHVPRLH
ncbi:hypothetical protein, partial [Sphingobium aquiterrae]|uniref:hypothetical protein n=1 Tax=Sphingobium aquiterrae TaxID=2038656 RepID=UPI00301A4E59